MSGIQEAGRHNPIKHNYGSIDSGYDQDLLEFEKPYVRQVGLYHQRVQLAEPRFPELPSEAQQERQVPTKQTPAPAAATSFSATELQAMSRQNVRTFHDPEGKLSLFACFS